MLKLLVIFVIITSTACYAEIMEPRQKQLDSFVTNLPRDYVRDLDSAHYYMNREGRNNEERVFMFYGFFGIHFKYDHNRAVQKQDVKEYSPYYTCRKRSGVCRDFSVLFKELCDRSGIPCFIALGRAKPGMKRALKDIVFMRMHAPSHAWNVVKFDEEWHLMDPTWTHISRIDKYYKLDSHGRRKYETKAKRPSRSYYDATSDFFYKKRNALHPAFYLSDSIPTFKTARRYLTGKEYYQVGYDFNSVLETLATNPYYLYSESYAKEQDDYCKNYSEVSFDWKIRTKYLELKHTEKDKITVRNCEKEIEKLSVFANYLESQGKTYRADLVRIEITLIHQRIQKEKAKAERLNR